MPNRLSSENSPYLLQHKDNPVDWYPWGDEALAKARKEDKPIFLSIGYAACHWCHVMERESFEDEDTAKLMNENFVNIKVDREERPDLDGIYMNAVVSMTGQGGWPMSVFLTPEGEPFYGGTYFPSSPRYGMPSFTQILRRVNTIWKDDPKGVRQSGSRLAASLREVATMGPEEQPLKGETIEEAALKLAQSYDWNNGGWGNAPKFPQPMANRFLLQRAAQGDKLSLDIAIHALREMAKGGMYDVVGGGFARYSVDEGWLVPHFEKMLYDNAQLARAYLHAFLITQDVFYRQICEETLDFIARELTHKQGGFFSSIDADSEGVEGKFYIWSYDEIGEILSNETSRQLMIAAYGITQGGNFEGNNILQRALSDDELSKTCDISVENIPAELRKLHKELYIARAKRVWPSIDDKVLVSWNALTLIAFAEAARYLHREDYLQIAQNNATFLLGEMRPADRLLRSWRQGNAAHNAYLEDYASLILGLLSIYQSDNNTDWFGEAVNLTEEMIDHFKDEDGGFFDTRDDHENLFQRPKDLQDNAIPSGSALAATALFEIAAYSSNSEWYDIAAETAGPQQEIAKKHPLGFSQWLCAIDFGTQSIQEIAILGNLSDRKTKAMVDVIWSEFRPFSVVAISPFPPSENSPALLDDRLLINNLSTAYVCHNFICKQPVTSHKEFKEQLAA